MERRQFNERETATILAALRLFQQEAEKQDMAEIFPDHFNSAEITPLTPEEIDQLCEEIALNS